VISLSPPSAISSAAFACAVPINNCLRDSTSTFNFVPIAESATASDAFLIFKDDEIFETEVVLNPSDLCICEMVFNAPVPFENHTMVIIFLPVNYSIQIITNLIPFFSHTTINYYKIPTTLYSKIL